MTQRIKVNNDQYSLLFDGVDDYVISTSTANTYSFGIAVFLRFKPKNTGAINWLGSKNGGSGDALRFRINANGTLNVYWENVESSSSNGLMTTNAVRYNEWNFLCIHVADDGAYKIYLNGVLKSGTFTGTPKTFTKLLIGKNYIYNFFTGSVKSVRLYQSVSLSDGDVENARINNIYPLNPSIQWDLNDGIGLVVTDSSGNGDNGTISGATWSEDVPNPPRKDYTNKVSVDDDARCSVSVQASSGNGTCTSKTASFLGKIKILTRANNFNICGIKDDASVDAFRLSHEQNTGYPFIWTVNNAGSGNALVKSSTRRLPVGRWISYMMQHIDNGDGTITGKVYIDNILWNVQTATRDVRTPYLYHFGSGSNYLTKTAVLCERVVTTDEYAQFHSNNIIPLGSHLVYKCNDGAGDTVYDSSGNGFNATGTSLAWNSDTPTKKRKTVGGNLIYNGDFAFVPRVNVPTTGNACIDGTAGGSMNMLFGWKLTKSGTVEAIFDENSLKISTKATGSYGEAFLLTTGYNTDQFQGFKLEPNTSYTLKYRMKTNYVSGDSNDGVFIFMNEANGSGSSVGSIMSLSKVKATQDWTEYTKVFTTKTTTARGHIELRLYGHTGAGTLIMDAWFADIQLQKTVLPVRGNV